MAWAIQQQIVRSRSSRHVLLLLANCANEDGQNAFPSVARLARESGLSERGVQLALRELLNAGVIREGDQTAARLRIRRRDKCPIVYDIVMDDGGRGEDAAPRETVSRGQDRASGGSERRNAGALHEARKAALQGCAGAPRRGVRDGEGAAQEACEPTARGEVSSPRAALRGEKNAAHGVKKSTERGEVAAPDPSIEPSKNPSIARARESLGGVGDALRRLAGEIGPSAASSWIAPLRVVSHDPPLVEAPNRWHAERIRQDFGGRLEAMLGRRVGIVAAETGAPRAPGVAAREARR